MQTNCNVIKFGTFAKGLSALDLYGLWSWRFSKSPAEIVIVGDDGNRPVYRLVIPNFGRIAIRPYDLRYAFRLKLAHMGSRLMLRC